jgi:hypothetical protein
MVMPREFVEILGLSGQLFVLEKDVAGTMATGIRGPLGYVSPLMVK